MRAVSFQYKRDSVMETRTASTRRTLLIIGLVTFATLLMSLTVLLFHQSLELTQLLQGLNNAEEGKVNSKAIAAMYSGP
ncbi:hypothetical protein IscW_ISCW006421 [Ixodes scapularis]|uniref:Uncharacterized protein n=1 Tax=Ixodes scapularis TaxID=6945 RepID=B7PM91_IXOSC|nr:hypothetical protein IscW_ISCW006421 [Ixodes scapularis]|eukprot:XP_002434889.1 hypothetical protein IscW_ISCW006421 [Ixodes scapularis]